MYRLHCSMCLWMTNDITLNILSSWDHSDDESFPIQTDYYYCCCYYDLVAFFIDCYQFAPLFHFTFGTSIYLSSFLLPSLLLLNSFSRRMRQTAYVQHNAHSSSHIFNYNWCLLLFGQRIRTHSGCEPFFRVNAEAFHSFSRPREICSLGQMGMLIKIMIKYSCRYVNE